jgi:hypothetical protein
LAAVRPGVAPVVACLVYSVSICALFGVSALYHRRVWSRRGFAVMRRLDHSMIFIFIAGTYTPFSVLLLPPGRATVILAVVWGGALAGVAMKLVWPHAPRWLSAPLYVALGWVAVFILPDLLGRGDPERHGQQAIVLVRSGEPHPRGQCLDRVSLHRGQLTARTTRTMGAGPATGPLRVRPHRADGMESSVQLCTDISSCLHQERFDPCCAFWLTRRP